MVSKFDQIDIVYARPPSPISLIVRAPSSVMVSSPPSIILTGSFLTLTCTIMLVEDKINGVEVVWTGPTDNLTADTTPTGTGTSYTSNLTITSLTASDAGTYTCTARLTSSLPFVQASIPTMASTNLTLQSNSHTYMHQFKCSTCSIISESVILKGIARGE